jgi:hypothetical protein
MSCVAACRTADTLTVVRRGRKGLSPWLVPALGVGAFVACWAIARATGHWESAVPFETFVEIYRQAEQIGH